MQVGVFYVWGGVVFGGFDCLGLVMWVFQQVGIVLLYFSQVLVYGGQLVVLLDLQFGDVLIFYFDVLYVGIYIGDGFMVYFFIYGVLVWVVLMDLLGLIYDVCCY